MCNGLARPADESHHTGTTGQTSGHSENIITASTAHSLWRCNKTLLKQTKLRDTEVVHAEEQQICDTDV